MENYYGYDSNDGQTTGTVGFSNGEHFSIKWENDKFAFSGDKYRSNAIEIGTRGYFIGTNVFTDDHQKAEPGLNNSDIFGTQLRKSEVESYRGSSTHSSPFYFGKRTGNRIVRIGYDHSFFGDLFQNGMHWLIGSPYFKRGDQNGQYIQYGTYDPFSMY